MSVEEQFAHIVLSDGKKYKDYIIAENTLLGYEFIEKDKFRIRGKDYYEGIVLCRGKNRKECRRLAMENRAAIPIFRFCQFPSSESSVVPTHELGNIEKQSPRQALKIPQRLEIEPSSPKNKKVFLSELKAYLSREVQKKENTATNEDLVNKKLATADRTREISDKPEKRKLESVTMTEDADIKTDNSCQSLNQPQYEFPKFKKNIANTYCAMRGITLQQKKIPEDNAEHKQAKLLVSFENESNKTINPNSKMIVKTPIDVKNEVNLQSLIESDIEEIGDVNEAVNTCDQSHVFPYEGQQHKYFGNLWNKEKLPKTHIGSPDRMQEYNALFRKYKKLGKQYEKLKTTNLSLKQYVKNTIDDCENVLMQNNILTLPLD